MRRKYTNKLCEMLDVGLISKDHVINACLSYMSEADVQDMMECNDMLEEAEEEL
jgi:hypothetical protein